MIESSTISHLARVISSEIDLDEVFDTFTQGLKRLVTFDRLSICVIEGGQVRFLAVYSRTKTELGADTGYPLKGSTTGWVAKQKKTLVVPDLALKGLSPLTASKSNEGLRSSIHVPLFSKGKVFGSLNLSSLQPSAYGEKEQEILEELAAQIAGAVQYARLYSLERAQCIELEKQKRKELNFIDAITHELKTPLTSIIASGGLLAEELGEEGVEPYQRLIRNIIHAAKTLEVRLSELLETAKTEEEGPRLQLQPLDIEPMLQRVEWQVSPIMQRKGQNLTLDLPDFLPTVEADSQRVEQVLLNLLTNASKFTPEGGNIILRAKKQNDELVLEVQDSGIGVSKEEQVRLFEPYYRVAPDRQQVPGVGLGLALSKRIVELHGGRIWVESEPKKGSTFAFSLSLWSRRELDKDSQILTTEF